MKYKNLKDNEININGFRIVREDITLDFLIANKFIKNELNDVEEYGVESLVFSQFADQVKDREFQNFATILISVNGVCGLKVSQEEYDIFIDDKILDSIYLSNNKIYYLTNDGTVYSYIQEIHQLV